MLRNPQFRIRFDVPHRFCVEPGYVQATHCQDFRAQQGALSGTWREPNTGLIMLQPSFLDDRWYDPSMWIPLSSWLKNPDYWQQVSRVNTPDVTTALSTFFTTILDAASSGSDIPAYIDTAVLASLALVSIYTSDTMVWVAQSNVNMARDEGFVWHYRALGDELHRIRNWFALQWDDWGFHFSLDGTCRVYQYGSDKSVAPTLIDVFEICSPGEIANQDGYFVFIPIPGAGISLIHSHTPQQLSGRASNGRSGAVRGHLIKLPPKVTETGAVYVHNGGPLTLGIASRLTLMQHKFGCHRIRYDTTAAGVYTDASFDPGYKHSRFPDSTAGLVLDFADSASVTSVAATLRNIQDNADWIPLTNRQGRVKLALSTSDARYTPFVIGSYVAWRPVWDIRDTQPVTPETLLELECTDDELGRFEGRCTALFKSEAGRWLCERGDTTFVVEYLDTTVSDEGEWRTYNGGLAQLESADAVMDMAGMYYHATWELCGLEKRFSEVTQQNKSAFDRLTVAQAINVVLEMAGFESIYSFPAAATSFQLPQMVQGQTWRWGCNAGDDGGEIIRSLLLLLRREHEEYRLRYDWDNQRWVMEAKPRDPDFIYTLSPFTDESAPDAQVLPIGNGDNLLLTLKVNPPEGSVYQARGRTKIEDEASEVASPEIINYDSIHNRDSVDFLGRIKTVRPVFAPLQDVPLLAAMTRRLFDATGHREMVATIPSRDFFPDFVPCTAAAVRSLDADGARSTVYTGFWLKLRHLRLDFQQGSPMIPYVSYELSTTWESEVK